MTKSDVIASHIGCADGETAAHSRNWAVLQLVRLGSPKTAINPFLDKQASPTKNHHSLSDDQFVYFIGGLRAHVGPLCPIRSDEQPLKTTLHPERAGWRRANHIVRRAFWTVPTHA
jgi:hypothetical protein